MSNPIPPDDPAVEAARLAYWDADETWTDHQRMAAALTAARPLLADEPLIDAGRDARRIRKLRAERDRAIEALRRIRDHDCASSIAIAALRDLGADDQR